MICHVEALKVRLFSYMFLTNPLVTCFIKLAWLRLLTTVGGYKNEILHCYITKASCRQEIRWRKKTLRGSRVSSITKPHSQGSSGSLRAWMSMKMMWIICYDLYSHQLSAKLSTYGIWTKVEGSRLRRPRRRHSARENLLETSRSEAHLEVLWWNNT